MDTSHSQTLRDPDTLSRDLPEMRLLAACSRSLNKGAVSWSPGALTLKSLSFSSRTFLHNLLWLGAEERWLGAGDSMASRRHATGQRCPLQSSSVHLNPHLRVTSCFLSSCPAPCSLPASSLSECYLHLDVWTCSQAPKASWGFFLCFVVWDSSGYSPCLSRGPWALWWGRIQLPPCFYTNTLYHLNLPGSQ